MGFRKKVKLNNELVGDGLEDAICSAAERSILLFSVDGNKTNPRKSVTNCYRQSRYR